MTQTKRQRPRLSSRMQQGMALKAVAYTALSAGCWPIGGLLIRPDLSGMLAVIGLAFSAAALLAIGIYRRGTHPEIARRLVGALLLLLALALSQYGWVVKETIARRGGSPDASQQVDQTAILSNP